MPEYLAGSCHCGSVRFRVRGLPEELIRCDCSLCRRKNALMWAVPETHLEITAGAEQLTLYQWNTRIAEHFFCSRCGIYTFHRRRMMPDHFGININCIEGLDISTLPVRPVKGSELTVVNG